jgi:hypothetical protein
MLKQSIFYKTYSKCDLECVYKTILNKKNGIFKYFYDFSHKISSLLMLFSINNMI